MPGRTRKRPNKANALARWDNEGGAAKGAPQEARDDMTSLATEEEHILRCLGAAVTGGICPRISSMNSLNTPFPWASCTTQLS
jgi:hypothetical protein